MAINDTIQTRLQGAQATPAVPAQGGGSPLDSAQAMLKQVSGTPFTNPQAEAEELNQTALALFMVIEFMKAMAQEIQMLKQGGQQPPVQGV